MDKRLEKRHKRQVSRAKNKVKLSEPDVRTFEQIEAARQASRPESGHDNKTNVTTSKASARGSRAAGTGSAAKTDA